MLEVDGGEAEQRAYANLAAQYKRRGGHLERCETPTPPAPPASGGSEGAARGEGGEGGEGEAGDEHYSMAQEFLRSLSDEQASEGVVAPGQTTPPQKQRARPTVVSPPRSAPERPRPPPRALMAHRPPTPAELADAAGVSGGAGGSAGGGAGGGAEAREEEVHVPMMMHVRWDELGAAAEGGAEGAPPARAVLRGQGLVRALCWCPGLEPARRLELLRMLLEMSTAPVDVDDVDPRDGCTVPRPPAALGATGCNPRVPYAATQRASRCCTGCSLRGRCPSRKASTPRRAVPRRRPPSPRRCCSCRRRGTPYSTPWSTPWPTPYPMGPWSTL